MWKLVSRAWADGRPLMAAGVAGAAVSAVVMYQEELHFGRVQEVRDDMVAEQAGRAREEKSEDPNRITKAPVLYEARVKTALGNAFDGPIALRELIKGEKVSVLEEDAGPDQTYFKCRSYQDDAKPKMEGLYPSKLLEKIELNEI